MDSRRDAMDAGGTRDAETALRRSFTVLVALTLASAVSSTTFFHPDEHHQVVEFAGLALGFTKPEELPWEYAARIRPWLQPALYFVVAKFAQAAGVADRFALLALFRVVTAVASLLAMRALAGVALRELPDVRMRKYLAYTIGWFGFLPYLFVRTSSETLAGALLAGAVALAWDSRAVGVRHAVACGALLGLAFEVRFQSAFASVGVLAWLAFVRRAAPGHLAILCSSGLVVLGLAALVDRWGYGTWCLPPLGYVRANVVEGIAGTFGREPFWAYPFLVVVNVFAPLAATSVLALAVAAWRHPRHVLVWAAVPFFVAHSFVEHKEERFLFPLVFLVPALVALAFGGAASAPRTRALVRMALAASAPVMLLQLARPLGFRAQLRWAGEFEVKMSGEPRVLVVPDIEFPRYPFLQPTRPVAVAWDGRCVPFVPARVFQDVPAPEPLAACDGAPTRQRLIASDLPFATREEWARLVTRATRGWNALRATGLPLPFLRFATVVEVQPAEP